MREETHPSHGPSSEFEPLGHSSPSPPRSPARPHLLEPVHAPPLSRPCGPRPTHAPHIACIDSVRPHGSLNLPYQLSRMFPCPPFARSCTVGSEPRSPYGSEGELARACSLACSAFGDGAAGSLVGPPALGKMGVRR